MDAAASGVVSLSVFAAATRRANGGEGTKVREWHGVGSKQQ